MDDKKSEELGDDGGRGSDDRKRSVTKLDVQQTVPNRVKIWNRIMFGLWIAGIVLWIISSGILLGGGPRVLGMVTCCDWGVLHIFSLGYTWSPCYIKVQTFFQRDGFG